MPGAPLADTLPPRMPVTSCGPLRGLIAGGFRGSEPLRGRGHAPTEEERPPPGWYVSADWKEPARLTGDSERLLFSTSPPELMLIVGGALDMLLTRA
jgi:hypothetical protein